MEEISIFHINGEPPEFGNVKQINFIKHELQKENAKQYFELEEEINDAETFMSGQDCDVDECNCETTTDVYWICPKCGARSSFNHSSYWNENSTDVPCSNKYCTLKFDIDIDGDDSTVAIA